MKPPRNIFMGFFRKKSANNYITFFWRFFIFDGSVLGRKYSMILWIVKRAVITVIAIMYDLRDPLAIRNMVSQIR